MSSGQTKLPPLATQLYFLFSRDLAMWEKHTTNDSPVSILRDYRSISKIKSGWLVHTKDIWVHVEVVVCSWATRLKKTCQNGFFSQSFEMKIQIFEVSPPSCLPTHWLGETLIYSFINHD